MGPIYGRPRTNLAENDAAATARLAPRAGGVVPPGRTPPPAPPPRAGGAPRPAPPRRRRMGPSGTLGLGRPQPAEMDSRMVSPKLALQALSQRRF